MLQVPASENPRQLGRFALTAEAIRMLGQIIRHVEAADFGEPFHDEEGRLLDQALRALATVTKFEGQKYNVNVMNQTSMYSM